MAALLTPLTTLAAFLQAGNSGFGGTNPAICAAVDVTNAYLTQTCSPLMILGGTIGAFSLVTAIYPRIPYFIASAVCLAIAVEVSYNYDQASKASELTIDYFSLLFYTSQIAAAVSGFVLWFGKGLGVF